FGTAPTAGNITETDVYSSPDSTNTSAHWVAQSRASYDSYGRVTCSENASGGNTPCIPSGKTSCAADAYTTCTSYTSTWGTGNPTRDLHVPAPPAPSNVRHDQQRPEPGLGTARRHVRRQPPAHRLPVRPAGPARPGVAARPGRRHRDEPRRRDHQEP